MTKRTEPMSKEERERDAADMWLGDAPLPEWMADTEQEEEDGARMRERMGLDTPAPKQPAAESAEPTEQRKRA